MYSVTGGFLNLWEMLWIEKAVKRQTISGKIFYMSEENQLLSDKLPGKGVKTNFYRGFFCLAKVLPN